MESTIEPKRASTLAVNASEAHYQEESLYASPTNAKSR
jgi:hypothetical protein